MKTDVELRDMIYLFVKSSALATTVRGDICKRERKDDSTTEDLCIAVLANQFGEEQEAYVNVNIYVPDLKRGTSVESDDTRLRELCKLCTEVFRLIVGDGYRITLDTQRVYAVDGKDEHFINNKLLIQILNVK